MGGKVYGRTELGKVLGITGRSVTRLKQKGILVSEGLTGSGINIYDVEASLARYREYKEYCEKTYWKVG